MQPADLYAAVVTRLLDIPELHGNVAYPQPNLIATSPMAIVVNGAPSIGPSTITRKSDIQEWRLNYTVRVLVDTNGEAPSERSLLVGILPRIVDAFDSQANGMTLASLFPGLPRPLKSFGFQGFAEGEVRYSATQNCYAMDVYFYAHFERNAELIPIGGTP